MSPPEKRPADQNRLAHSIVADATGPDKAKNPAAAELGRRGGLKGGPARARKLTRDRRSEIAHQAAAARWDISRPGSRIPVTRTVLDTLGLLGGEASAGAVREDIAADGLTVTPGQVGSALSSLSRRTPPLAERTPGGTWRLTSHGWDEWNAWS
ncbi:MAG TPA: hypothetical protein VKU77_37010 [Streptosporangiaceae bacterium]|nr:hypothetical protein [Streptosporangiaceae bacterium]